MNGTPSIYHNLLDNFHWVRIENDNMNDSLCYVNYDGECYLFLTPSGELRWHPDMYDKHYGRYGISLGDFRTYIRNMVYSRFDGRHIYSCRKRKNKPVYLLWV